MRKNILSMLIIPMFAMVISSCTGASKDNERELSFKESEYQIHSGERITVEQKYNGVTYSFAGEVPVDTNVDSKTGEITFSESTPNYSQVILTASFEELQSDQAIVTLLQNEVTTELSFHTPIKNIIDGDYILVTSSNNTAITYALKNPVTGVSIDSMTGRISYNSAAVEGSVFTVVASSAGSSIEENYYVTVNKLAVSLTPSQTIEIGSNTPATYILDFSNIPTDCQEGIIGLMNGNKYANESDYSYDSVNHILVVNSAFVNTFESGENTLRIITSRNIISVKIVLVTKFIRNAHDLQSINTNRETLGGYYVLENDIDLTDYLAKGGEGYNDGRGWNQIGIYHDLENDPTRDSFTGTFDGNGHVISGFFEERADDLAHNEGLFGYTTNQALIKNVGFVGASRTTQGRNFIGGFVGFNEGTIRNCWVNVNISNKHEDKIFHSIGAFAGANTGIIDSCYTLGKSLGDNLVGALVGKNYGDITNCYCFNETVKDFCGTQITGSHTNCQIFTTLGEMKNFDYRNHFDNSAWDFVDGDFPTLKHLISIEHANGIEIANKEKEVFKGEDIVLDVVIHPNDLRDQYIDDVNYTVTPNEGSGVTQDDTNKNVFHTNGALVNEITIAIKLSTEFGEFAAAKSFKINTPIESVSLIDDFPTYVEPGKQYAFNVNITPSNAPQQMEWKVLEKEVNGKIQKPGRFCYFTDNVLTITEDMMNFSTKEANPKFSVQGTAINGMTVTKELTLRRIHYLSESYSTAQEGDHITDRVLTFYKDSTDEYALFTLPSSAEMSGMVVTRFNTVINTTRTGHTVKVPIDLIKEIPNRQLTFTFRCGTGDTQVIYRGYACYIDHNRYVLNDVSNYIALDSAADFHRYFRMTLNDTDTSKWTNYDKTFVLTNDIDFQNETGLVAIGYYTTSHADGLHPFSGKIYGFGHTIKNAKFQYSERYFIAGPSEPGKKADPNTYRVGFFGFFQGEIYDVIFENITTVSYNYGGAFAGTIRSGGYLENVVFINSKTYSANETDYTIDDVIQGRIAATSAGTFVAVTYNGTAVGLVGK